MNKFRLNKIPLQNNVNNLGFKDNNQVNQQPSFNSYHSLNIGLQNNQSQSVNHNGNHVQQQQVQYTSNPNAKDKTNKTSELTTRVLYVLNLLIK